MNVARFSSMRVAVRLSACFGVLGLMLAMIIGVAVQRMAVMGEKTNDLADNWLPSVELVNKMNTLTSDFRIAEFRHVVSTEAADMAQAETHLADIGKRLASHEAEYTKLISSDKERALYAQFAETWKRYLALHERMLVESRQNRTEQARALLDGESRQVYDKASAILLELVQLNHEGGDLAGREAHDAHQSALWTMGCVGMLSLVMAVALAVILTRSITAPLREAVSVAQQVASGDLTVRPDTQRDDEFGDLLRAMNQMAGGLSELVGQVRSSSDSIATGASQIACGNVDLSQRTEEQASALQQTASTMEELGSTVRLNAENAQHADQLAKNASTVAAESGEVVSHMVGAMQEIQESSRKISDIIAVIDGIAFQTNILALNAAVEAARAGEQGRGFAVVAGEVRTLAQRSAEAAKEIKTLINSSVERVAAGTALADRASGSINEVVSSIRRVTEIMSEIASSSSEQSTAVSQVGEAVSQMDQVTQQNAALVEESAAAASSLSTQAQALVGAVAVFKTA